MNKRITLSFDNGPTPGVTEQVLDVLAEHDLRSSFFVIGNNLRVPEGRACAERAQAEGHWVGNHTTSHSILFGTDNAPGLADAEIEEAQRLIGDLARPERLFRPYAGGGVLDRRVFSPATLAHLQREGYTCVLWNSIPHDWDRPEEWVDTAMAHVAEQDWTLVVVHDIDTGAMDHLPGFLRRLSAEGVEVVQEFPDTCQPIVRGELRAPLDHLMPEEATRP